MRALRSPDHTNSADKAAKNARSPTTDGSTRATAATRMPATDDDGETDRGGDGDEIAPPLSDVVRRRGAAAAMAPYDISAFCHAPGSHAETWMNWRIVHSQTGALAATRTPGSRRGACARCPHASTAERSGDRGAAAAPAG